jgi:enamine deaminase RidA (YjgF/YER057c/UK114 family)
MLASRQASNKRLQLTVLVDMVCLRLYIVDYRPEKAEAVGQALRESFAGLAKPAATWIGVASLADPGFLIEIEATAVLE